jgi:hypothetical protein
MAKFPNCEVQLASDPFPYALHAFQVQQVTVQNKTLDQKTGGDYALMFCTHCGASYVLDKDKKWHAVETGDAWTI